MEENHPLDYLFLLPKEGAKFLRFECAVGLMLSLFISFSSLMYLVENPCVYFIDYFTKLWLLTFSIFRLVDIPIKLLILLKLHQISKNIQNEAGIFSTRRLMELVRGKTFQLQIRLNSFSISLLGIGLLFVLVQIYFYGIKNKEFYIWIMTIYILRLIYGVVNFRNEEKKTINHGYPRFDQFVKNGANLTDIEKFTIIKTFVGTHEDEICGICTDVFINSEKIRVLPCSDSHKFHLDCIDKWLMQKSVCPFCLASIKKSKVW